MVCPGDEKPLAGTISLNRLSPFVTGKKDKER